MIYWLWVAVIGLGIVLGAVLRAYDRLLRELSRTKVERENWETRVRHKAVIIVEEARDKALEILQEARIEVESRRQVVDKKLESLGEKQMEYYKQVLQNISKAVETGAERELGQFRQALETETVQAQKVIGKRLESEYEQMLAEVEEEKKKRLADLDRKLMAVIKQAANSVIGKALTLEEHTELVIKSLEEAKRQNVL